MAGIFERGEAWVAATTWLELRVRLQGESEAAELIRLYEESVAGTIDVTREVALAAYAIRKATPNRVPMIDCLIAGSARVHGMTLVHRDRHMAAIPQRLVRQKQLPAK